MSSRVTRLLPLFACLVAAACAPVPATGPVAQPGTVTTGGSGGAPSPARPTAAAIDSGPSADAEAVLATIPEPLDSSLRVPPPVPAEADTGAAVPVPVETVPLGVGSAVDSLFAAPGATAAPGTPPPTGGATGAGAAAGAGAAGAGTAAGTPARPAGPCFRVQVAAPDNAPEADAKRAAATSLLLAPFVVDKEGKLFKVRSRDCLDDAAATRLRDRAVNNGFDGAFKVKGTS